MSSKSVIIASCWFAVAVIASVYIWVALAADILGDLLFGLYVPVGALVFVALVVTLEIQNGSEPENQLDKKLSDELQEINQKLDSVTKEVEDIKKAIEE
ncbi:MAG: hypothetical protein NWF03_01265 [Candidatus Bathyarchaeota archaeon]|nr:hypothetical protein [Candidatus Bathyarchaeota archaeon]